MAGFLAREQYQNMAKTASPRIALWSAHRGNGWPTQIGRAERWYTRMVSAESFEDRMDFTISFFQNCYLIKEWLEKTGDVSRSELNSHQNDHFELRVCRDIANATKHFQLSSPSLEFEIAIGRESIVGQPGKTRIFVLADKDGDIEKFNANELARLCLDSWKKFVNLKQPRTYKNLEELVEIFPMRPE